jgi:hypothetical protein
MNDDTVSISGLLGMLNQRLGSACTTARYIGRGLTGQAEQLEQVADVLQMAIRMVKQIRSEARGHLSEQEFKRVRLERYRLRGTNQTCSRPETSPECTMTAPVVDRIEAPNKAETRPE